MHNHISEATPASSHAPFRIGEPFNPYRGACGFYPADVVGRQQGLSDGAKRLYERLTRYAGKDGECFPSQETLADDLGKSERQIRYDLQKLRDASLITWQDRQAQNRRGNRYLFLWHPMFDRQSVAARDRQPIAANDPDWDTATGNPLPPATGNPLPLTDDDCRSRPARFDTVTGNPLPGNYIHELHTVKTDDTVREYEREEEPPPNPDETIIDQLAGYLNLRHLPPPDNEILNRIAGELGDVPFETFRGAARAAVDGLSERPRNYGFFIHVARRVREMHKKNLRRHGRSPHVSGDHESRAYH